MNFEDFKAKAVADKAFAAEFAGKKPTEIVELAKAKGYNISTADFKAAISDEALDAAAGGITIQVGPNYAGIEI